MTAPKVGFEELIARIASLRSANERVSVAIAGFGGSGKSTLAFRMRHRFEGDCTIVSTDLLYSRTPHSRSVLGMTDWATFAAIAKSVHSEERLRYCGRTYFGDEFEVDEPMPNIVVFEGIRLLRPELMSLYDVAVWIDCPQDIATARAKQRNAQQGDSDAELALWDTLWTPTTPDTSRSTARSSWQPSSTHSTPDALTFSSRRSSPNRRNVDRADSSVR